jgi:hypothetical protein
VTTARDERGQVGWRIGAVIFVALVAVNCLHNAYGSYQLYRQQNALQGTLRRANLIGATSDQVGSFLDREGMAHSPLIEGPGCCFKSQEFDRYIRAPMKQVYTRIGLTEGVYWTNIEVMFIFDERKHLTDYDVSESFDAL